MESSIREVVDRYLAGPEALSRALHGLSPEEIDAIPIVGRWSIRQVVCHLADAEILYADRIKRIIAEENPRFARAEPDKFLAVLNVERRDVNVELRLIEAIRAHVGQILKVSGEERFARQGIHSTLGPMTLASILEYAANHIPHHIAFVDEKRRAMQKATTNGDAERAG